MKLASSSKKRKRLGEAVQVFGRIIPWHEGVEIVVRPACSNALERELQPGIGVASRSVV